MWSTLQYNFVDIILAENLQLSSLFEWLHYDAILIWPINRFITEKRPSENLNYRSQ